MDHLSDQDKFYLGLILFGPCVLALGFFYCISRCNSVRSSRLRIWIFRIWISDFWDKLFMRVFKLEKIGLGRKNHLKIVNCLSKKNIDGCPSIIEVNGVYYGIEKSYYRYSQGSQYSHLQVDLILLLFQLSASVESCNVSTNISNFLLPPTSYEIKNHEKTWRRTRRLPWYCINTHNTYVCQNIEKDVTVTIISLISKIIKISIWTKPTPYWVFWLSKSLHNRLIEGIHHPFVSSFFPVEYQFKCHKKIYITRRFPDFFSSQNRKGIHQIQTPPLCHHSLSSSVMCNSVYLGCSAWYRYQAFNIFLCHILVIYQKSLYFYREIF